MSLTEIQARIAKDEDAAAQIKTLNVSVDAARTSSASRQESPFKDGLYIKLASDKFEEGVGVGVIKRRDGSLAPYYCILVDICSDKEGKNVVRPKEGLFGTMLRKSEEQRTDVTTNQIIPFAEGSFNATPECQTARTLEDLFNALVGFAGGKTMRIISVAYTGLNRRGEQMRMHVVNLVKS